MSIIFMGIMAIATSYMQVNYGWQEYSGLMCWLAIWAIFGQFFPETFMGKASIILSWILFICTLGMIVAGRMDKSSGLNN